MAKKQRGVPPEQIMSTKELLARSAVDPAEEERFVIAYVNEAQIDPQDYALRAATNYAAVVALLAATRKELEKEREERADFERELGQSIQQISSMSPDMYDVTTIGGERPYVQGLGAEARVELLLVSERLLTFFIRALAGNEV